MKAIFRKIKIVLFTAIGVTILTAGAMSIFSADWRVQAQSSEPVSPVKEKVITGVDRKKIDRIIKKQMSKDPSEYNTDWFGTMLIAGLFKWHDTGYPDVVEYTSKWLDYHYQSHKTISDSDFHKRAQAGRNTVVRGYSLLFSMYAGYFGVSFACGPLYQLTGNETARQVCKDAGDIILNKFPRNELGILQMNEQNDGFTIPDNAYFFVPSLFIAARAYDKEVREGDTAAKETQDKLMAFGFDQLKRFTDLFLDREKKIAKTLYRNGKLGETYWTRANGWLLWSIVESVEYMDKDSELYRYACETLDIMAQGISKYQDISGALHLLVDEADTPLETTGTLFAAYGIHKAVRLGWIDKKYLDIAVKAWNYIDTQVDYEGNIAGCYIDWAVPAEERRLNSFGVLNFVPGMMLTASAEFEK